jgi:hypothetical protein
MPLTSNRRASPRATAVARRCLIAVAVVAALAHCAPGDTDGGRASAQTVETASRAPSEPCRVVARPVELRGLPEASGVAVSRRTAGILWSHNDEGEPVVHALDERGAVRRRVRIAGADVTDWEAVAVGPCPGGSCLFVADLGDNDATRSHVTIYRVPEPTPAESATREAEAFHATYPDGAHDAEALIVTGEGDLFVVTKGETGHIAVYRFPRPLRAGSIARLQQVAVLGPKTKKQHWITDASASPDGQWIALRTRNVVTFYRTSDFASGRRGETISFDVSELGEKQGEGISIAGDGSVYLVSEGGGKKRPGTLARIVCELTSRP